VNPENPENPPEAPDARARAVITELEVSKQRRRRSWSIATDLCDYVKEKKLETGKDESTIVEECILEHRQREEHSGEALSMRFERVEAQLRQVTDDFEKLTEKIETEGTKEHEFGIFITALINVNPKFPLGPYSKIGEKLQKENADLNLWDQLRFTAVQDLRDDPNWAQQLGLKSSTGKLKLSEACTFYKKFAMLRKKKAELTAEHAALLTKLAEPPEELLPQIAQTTPTQGETPKTEFADAMNEIKGKQKC
jgi:hypothetical protein